MPSIDIEVAKTTSLRAFSGYVGGTDKAYQAEFEQHLIGYSHEGDYLWGLLAFDINWSGMNIGQITLAELVLHTDNVPGEKHHHNDGGSFGRENLKLSMVTTSWAPAGSGGEENWNDELAVPKVDANYRVYGGAGRNVTEQVEFVVNVTEIVMGWAPASVKGPSGAAGKAKANHGILMQTSGSVEQAKTRGWCVASKHHSTTSWAPVLRLTFASNIGPGTTVLVAPAGSIPDTTGINFVGEFLSPGLGIKMTARSIEVREQAGGAAAWSSLNVAVSESEADAATFLTPLPASLKSQTGYEWRARIKDSRGTWTPWTAYVPFTISTSAPSLALVGPSGTYSTLNGVRFEATYTDPEGNRLRSLRIQVRSTTSPSSPVWDTGDHFWDTGDTAARRAEIDTATIRRLYEGEALLPGGFSFRIRATDRLGGESAWVYGTFTLTKGYEPRPGATNLLTGYGRDRYDWRIQLRAMGTDRAPGVLVAEITDAAAVGCSEFYNSPGEFYFTVPINHPQAAAIEPYKTHWSLEMYRGEGWWPVAYGLITDYDATDEEVVFYGLDYVGILSLLYDERFNEADSADKPVETGGSKYNNWRISSIIKNQLDLAVATANSPVGFITVAPTSDYNEFITIFATFKERLSFISGLIESHRAGTGVRTRLVVEKDITGGYTFRLLDNPGLDRDAITLAYGELVQGFHVVPFGAFGTRVHGIGRAVDGTKPYYNRATAPGVDEEVFGSFPQTRLWADIADLNDLKRRVKQAARNVGKIGKRVGLGLRVTGLDVKDGWDITDSVKVTVKRGVVDTTRFGSDWFTIWGWQWEWFENYPTLTLSILPREDNSEPDPDLLPSDPVIIPPPPWIPPLPPVAPTTPTIMCTYFSPVGGGSPSSKYWPAGCIPAAGDILLVGMAYRDQVSVTSIPTSFPGGEPWTILPNAYGGGLGLDAVVWYQTVAVGGETGIRTAGHSGGGVWCLYVLRGVDVTKSQTVYKAPPGSSGTWTTPITLNYLMPVFLASIYAGQGDSGYPTYGAGAGWTLLGGDNPSADFHPHTAVVHKVTNSPTATETPTATISIAKNYRSLAVALYGIGPVVCPIPGQWKRNEFVADGDGVTTDFQTDCPYAPNSLVPKVDGHPIITGLTELNPVAGTFRFDFAPKAASGDTRAERVTVDYQGYM